MAAAAREVMVAPMAAAAGGGGGGGEERAEAEVLDVGGRVVAVASHGAAGVEGPLCCDWRARLSSTVLPLLPLL